MQFLIYITQTSEDNKKTSQNLFLIKTNYSPKEIVQKYRRLSHEIFEQWFYELPIEVILLGLMTSREENAINNGINVSKITSKIINTGVRIESRLYSFTCDNNVFTIETSITNKD